MDHRSGSQVKIGSGIRQYAYFVPENLPPNNPSLQYDNELINLISEANRYIGKLDEIIDSLFSPNHFVHMYMIKEATISSRIEGAQATFTDLIKAAAGMADEVPNDVNEIENYIKAINYGFERLSILPFSLSLIKEIHAILIDGMDGVHKTPGEFRTMQSSIGRYSISMSTYLQPSAEYVVGLLDNFERFMHEEDYLSPLIKVALLHSQFEMIHPFFDGNGRLGRLLIAFYLASNDILDKPTVLLSKYFNKYQQEYYNCLYNIHSKGDYETWIKFFLRGVIEASKESIAMAKELKSLREHDFRRVSTPGRLSGNALIIYEGLFEKPTVSIEEVMKKLTISHSTASRLIERMIDIGILSSLGSGKKKKIFVYRSYMDIFSKD